MFKYQLEVRGVGKSRNFTRKRTIKIVMHPAKQILIFYKNALWTVNVCLVLIVVNFIVPSYL